MTARRKEFLEIRSPKWLTVFHYDQQCLEVQYTTFLWFWSFEQGSWKIKYHLYCDIHGRCLKDWKSQSICVHSSKHCLVNLTFWCNSCESTWWCTWMRFWSTARTAAEGKMGSALTGAKTYGEEPHFSSAFKYNTRGSIAKEKISTKPFPMCSWGLFSGATISPSKGQI